MNEFVTVNVPARFREMVEIDQFLATINEHAILTVTDSTGHLLYVNDAFCRLTQWDRSELIGRHYSLFSGGYHPEAFYDELWATIRTGAVWRGRVKNRARDGTSFWIDSIVKPVLNPDGDISHVISVRADITQLVETQEALEFIRQNEAAIRRILAISSSNIPAERMLVGALEVLSLIPWLANVSHSAVYLRTPGSEDLALAARQGPYVDEAADQRPCLGECICRDALESRTLQLVACAGPHDPHQAAGKLRHIAVPIAGQATAHGVLVFSLRDDATEIAKHKTFFADICKAIAVGIEQIRTKDGLKAEREQVLHKQHELEEKSALMEAGFDNMAEGLVALTPDLIILAANKRFAELNELPPSLLRHGYSFEPVLEHLNQIFRHQGHTKRLTVNGVAKVIRSGSYKTQTFEFKSGRTVEIRVNPIPEVGAVFTVTDVTQSLLVEHRVRQGYKLEALGDLAGGVAHEYNSLLTAVQGFARRAMKKLGDEDVVREALQEISEASGRAAEITQQMLTFSTKRVLTSVVVDIGEVVRSMEPMLRVFVQSKLEIRFDIRSGAYASVDPGLLTQCMTNLVTNSRQAMPEGGTITISCTAIELDEPLVASHGDRLAPGRYVCVAVSDTGRGIDPDDFTHIFDPFFSTRGVGAGTGLGLSMVFGMAKNQNGAIHVESAPGEGATFTIYLPEVDPPAQTATVAAVAPEALSAPPMVTAERPRTPNLSDATDLMRFL